MAVTTKQTFKAVGDGGQSATVFEPIVIELNNQDDLDVYVTLSGGTRVLNYRQGTASTTDANHPQVKHPGLYFPSVSTGVTLYNYQINAANNTITFNGDGLPSGAIVSIERRTRDESGNYTSFSGGSTIRSTDLNRAFYESNYTAQEARNKAFDIESRLYGSNIDGKTISTGSLSSSTTEIPTSSAVSTYVANQLDTIGGFIAIANEVSFPNEHPDIKDDAGTVIAISDVGGLVVPNNGTSTTGRTLGGATVTITDFPTPLRNQTLAAGMGLLVKTTGTLNTYNYHKAVGTDSDIISISASVDSFNQRYRFGADDPTSSNDDGDLFYNTTTKTFKVYDATGSGQWAKTVPTDAQLNQISIVSAELGWSDDLGFITETLTTASGGDINTVADNITSVNRYANEYKIASSAPSSPSEGHLWYDSTNNVIKFYSGSAWQEAFSQANIVDEDNMASNSATKVPSQQSVKAYVDAVNWLDQSAKTDGSLIYYNNSASKFKADATTTTSTIVDGGSF